ncbi:MAG: oxygenase MpaB family protein [Nannocystaceae bacterium]
MTTIRWTNSLFDKLVTQGDQRADAVAQAVLARGDLGSINRLMRTLTHNAEPVPEELPPEVIAYFEDSAALPPWADPAQIEVGQSVFVRYGQPILQSLMLRALPECYAMSEGAEILVRTGRLAQLTRQRVLETVHFTVDVMIPGGLGEHGRGIRSAQRVRLLHAAIRTHLREGGHIQAGREPINQLEMLATLGSFSALTIDSIRRLGVDLSTEERDAYIHCWNVVGYVMGIRANLLFRDLEDGLELWRHVRERECAPSEAGTALTQALLEFANGLVPGWIFDGINPTMLRHVCGDELADLLEVPPANWMRVFLRGYRRLVRASDDIQDVGPVARWIVRHVSHRAIVSLLGRGRAGARPSFDIPASLRASWGIPEAKEN